MLNTWEFPQPIPDELGYSVIARYIHSWSGLDERGLLRQTFGQVPTSIHPACPSHVSALADKALPEHRAPTMEFFLRHTMAPYYLSFEDEAVRCRTYDALAGTKTPSVAKLLNLTNEYSKSTAFLRICLDCHNDHLRAIGMGAWLRTHQIPGVLHCEKHASLLRTCFIPFYSRKSIHFLLPESQEARASLRLSGEPPFDNRLERKISAYSRRLLNTTPDRRVSPTATYREYLMQLGYRNSSGNLDRLHFEQDFNHWLKSHRRNSERIGAETWWRRMLTAIPGRSTPLQHIILNIFIDEQGAIINRIQPDLFNSY